MRTAGRCTIVRSAVAGSTKKRSNNISSIGARELSRRNRISGRSELLVKQKFASAVFAGHGPAVFFVKPLGARTLSGTEVRDRVARYSQRFAGPRKKRLTDASALITGSDEQRPYPALSDVTRSERLHYPFILPNPHFRPLNELGAMVGGHQVRVRQPVLTDQMPDLHHARYVALN